jgi:hypothetical protein
MRKAITVVMLLAWFAILGTCQMLACAPHESAGDACCPKHAVPKVPCPHELLEKAKPGKMLAHGEAAAPTALLSIPTISESLRTVRVDTRLPNLAGLYLRNRVLLI